MRTVLMNSSASVPRLDPDPSISHLLDRLYAVISFEEGDEPNWPGLEGLFSKHARITRITPEGTDYMDRASFLAMTRNLVEIGAYTSFFEFEVERDGRALRRHRAGLELVRDAAQQGRARSARAAA